MKVQCCEIRHTEGQTGLPATYAVWRFHPPRPAGRGGSGRGLRKSFPKIFFRNFRHCLHNVVNIFFLTHRVAVHVFLGTRAQVYTRDATHRPTATSTPGRGCIPELLVGEMSVPGRGMSGFHEICQIFRNFRKKVKKSEKYPPPMGAQGGGFVTTMLPGT